MAAFYQALQLGDTGKVFNPIFYVSSSPWNLYDLLTDFMDVHAIPTGPLFLQDFGLDRDKFISADHDEHKITHIERLLDLYPKLPFILIGDSGQADPEIYSTILEKYPTRILAIYIRDIHPEHAAGRARPRRAGAGREITKAPTWICCSCRTRWRRRSTRWPTAGSARDP